MTILSPYSSTGELAKCFSASRYWWCCRIMLLHPNRVQQALMIIKATSPECEYGEHRLITVIRSYQSMSTPFTGQLSVTTAVRAWWSGTRNQVAQPSRLRQMCRLCRPQMRSSCVTSPYALFYFFRHSTADSLCMP